MHGWGREGKDWLVDASGEVDGLDDFVNLILLFTEGVEGLVP